MSLLVIPFSTYPFFTGAGSLLAPPWYAVYPAEYGCMAAPGTLPHAPGIVALTTNYARMIRARAWGDGTAIKATAIAIGVGGHDPADPMRPLPIDPELLTLRAETYRTTRLVYENPRVDGRGGSYAAPLGRTEYVGGMSEIGLIATVLASPIAAEVGTTFLYSVVHTGLVSKTDRHVETLRILELV